VSEEVGLQPSSLSALLYVADYKGVTTSAGASRIARIATIARLVQKPQEGVALDRSGFGQYYR
jgi:hypothetical protein